MTQLVGNRNAYIGKDAELLFKNSIINHSDIIDKVKDIFGIKGNFSYAINTGMYTEKADVKIGFSCGHNIDVSIKAYKQAVAYNQLIYSMNFKNWLRSLLLIILTY
ncbi:MAG TPA: hypothetical protein LFV90_00650 [Rickettsia endosymbiont of Columbicola hoogstraali]|nr:hypothetical protein [Rickettsia endosymbiont of Columbicola hoogstraali]